VVDPVCRTLWAIERRPVRSRLRAKDIALLPPFETFMDQEISAQEETCRNVVSIFLGGSEALSTLEPCLEGQPAEDRAELLQRLEALRDEYREEQIRTRFHALADTPACRALLESVPAPVRAATAEHRSQASPTSSPSRPAASRATRSRATGPWRTTTSQASSSSLRAGPAPV